MSLRGLSRRSGGARRRSHSRNRSRSRGRRGAGARVVVLKRGADVAPSDVAEDDVRRRVVLRDEGGVALRGVAGPVAAAVQPVHELAGVVPDGEGQHHAAAERLTHRRQAAELRGGARVSVA